MALNPAKLQKDIDDIVKSAATKAFAAVSDVKLPQQNTDSYLSEKQIKNLREKQIKLTSEKFGQVFADESSTELAKVIDAYIRSMTLVPVLTSPAGPVVGTITVT